MKITIYKLIFSIIYDTFPIKNQLYNKTIQLL